MESRIGPLYWYRALISKVRAGPSISSIRTLAGRNCRMAKLSELESIPGIEGVQCLMELDAGMKLEARTRALGLAGGITKAK